MICLSPPILSSAFCVSTGLICGSLEEMTASVVLLSTGLKELPLRDFRVFVGVFDGDLLEVVVFSLLDSLRLSWRPLVNFSC